MSKLDLLKKYKSYYNEGMKMDGLNPAVSLDVGDGGSHANCLTLLANTI